MNNCFNIPILKESNTQFFCICKKGDFLKKTIVNIYETTSIFFKKLSSMFSYKNFEHLTSKIKKNIFWEKNEYRKNTTIIGNNNFCENLPKNREFIEIGTEGIESLKLSKSEASVEINALTVETRQKDTGQFNKKSSEHLTSQKAIQENPNVISEVVARSFTEYLAKKKIRLTNLSYETKENFTKQIIKDLSRNLSISIIHDDKSTIFNQQIDKKNAEEIYENFSQHISSIFPNDKTKYYKIMQRSDQGIFNSVFAEILIDEHFADFVKKIAPTYCDEDNPSLASEYYLSTSSHNANIIKHEIKKDGSIINSSSFCLNIFYFDRYGNQKPKFDFEISFSCNLMTDEYESIICTSR